MSDRGQGRATFEAVFGHELEVESRRGGRRGGEVRKVEE
jgi:hypothetical protein